MLAGYSAAELLGAGCAPPWAPAEVLVPRDVRRHRDLVVRRATVLDADVCSAGGCRVTTPLRTAWDLARRLPLVPAVVAVDALARRGRFDPAVLLTRRTTSPGARSCRALNRVVELADPGAESVMETRLRLNLVLGGLPRPEVQLRVDDPYGLVLAASTSPTPASSWPSSTTAAPTSPTPDPARTAALLATRAPSSTSVRSC